jgi:hypothetical protein
MEMADMSTLIIATRGSFGVGTTGGRSLIKKISFLYLLLTDRRQVHVYKSIKFWTRTHHSIFQFHYWICQSLTENDFHLKSWWFAEIYLDWSPLEVEENCRPPTTCRCPSERSARPSLQRSSKNKLIIIW